MNFARPFSRSLLLCALLAPVCGAQVKLRWTQRELPPAQKLGVNEVVIPWNDGAKASVAAATRHGYHVYLQVDELQSAAAAKASKTEPLAGLIVKPADGEKDSTEKSLAVLHATYPRLDFRILSPWGKQPQMRGHLIFERNGVLQASSPTEQPWVDSNLAAVQLAEAFHPERMPVYTFSWAPARSFQGLKGPTAKDYCTAIFEAGAFHAHVILEVPDDFQKSLAANEADSWSIWKQVQACMAFDARQNGDPFKRVSSVGVWTEIEASAYEAVNLMVRHNIPVRVLPPAGFLAGNLDGLDVLTVFAAPDKDQAEVISRFARQGGTAVLVDAHGKYPWQVEKAIQNNERSVEYAVGDGRVLELTGGVANPETFAQDVRRLMNRVKAPLTTWNSLTTLVVPYRDAASGETVLELLNYAPDAVQVQIRVKGEFPSIRFESPEHSCCEVLKGTVEKGFTEFVVRDLIIAGRVHLKPETQE
jgi:hypothetical protein